MGDVLSRASPAGLALATASAAQSSPRDPCNRLRCRTHCGLWHRLCVLRSEPRTASSPSLQRDSTSDCRVDCPAGCGSLPVRSPWQNGYAERWIARLRRDCLDHVIPINERQLRRVIRSYVDYCHVDRTHLGLEKDAPAERPIETCEMGEVVAISRVGGLHHRYWREHRTAA